MIIQKLIGPSKEVCNEWGMYFRKVDKEGNDITTYPYDDGDVMFHKLIDGVKASEVAAESFPLEIKQGEGANLLVEDGKITGVQTFSGATYHCKAVIICSGTYLKARCIYGDVSQYTGPNGLQAANHLTDCLHL